MEALPESWRDKQVMLTLRLRLPSGQATIKVNTTATFAELRAHVASTASAAEETLVLSTGFPPTALLLEDEASIAGSLNNMDTLTVSHAAASGQAVAMGKPPNKRSKKTTEPKLSLPAAGGMMTVSDLAPSSGGESSSTSKKRPAPSGGRGGGNGGGKRRATALHLGSEEGIGASLLSAVSSRKGAGALHKEDPASAFLKAASASALVHHQEEVLANERFQAALGGAYEIELSDSSRRLDGEATEGNVRFKVGRLWKQEAFTLLALPELRGVLQAVLEGLRSDDPSGDSVELLKPFKMAHVSNPH